MLACEMSEPGKSALVLFYDMNLCVQYKVSTNWLFYLTLVCLYDHPCISYVLTCVILSSLSSRASSRTDTSFYHSLITTFVWSNDVLCRGPHDM